MARAAIDPASVFCIFECWVDTPCSHKRLQQPSVGSNILIRKMILQLCTAEFRSILSTYLPFGRSDQSERKRTFLNWLRLFLNSRSFYSTRIGRYNCFSMQAILQSGYKFVESALKSKHFQFLFATSMIFIQGFSSQHHSQAPRG